MSFQSPAHIILDIYIYISITPAKWGEQSSEVLGGIRIRDTKQYGNLFINSKYFCLTSTHVLMKLMKEIRVTMVFVHTGYDVESHMIILYNSSDPTAEQQVLLQVYCWMKNSHTNNTKNSCTCSIQNEAKHFKALLHTISNASVNKLTQYTTLSNKHFSQVSKKRLVIDFSIFRRVQLDSTHRPTSLLFYITHYPASIQEDINPNTAIIFLNLIQKIPEVLSLHFPEYLAIMASNKIWNRPCLVDTKFWEVSY